MVHKINDRQCNQGLMTWVAKEKEHPQTITLIHPDISELKKGDQFFNENLNKSGEGKILVITVDDVLEVRRAKGEWTYAHPQWAKIIYSYKELTPEHKQILIEQEGSPFK